MDRRWIGVGVAIVAAFLGGAPQPEAQAPPESDRITWTAEWKYEFQPPRDYARGRVGPHHRWRVRFTGVQQADAQSTGGPNGWLSRQFEWDYQEYFEDTGFARHPENNWRFLARFTRTCTHSGTLRFGPTDGHYTEDLPTVQPTCVHTQVPIAEGYSETATHPGGSKHILNHLLNWPRTGCADGEVRRDQEPDGTITTASWSVTVSRGLSDAVVVVDRAEYDAFVPEPGKTLTFNARSTRPVRFRFELDRAGTSRFPGYATNANVDDELFFETHDLVHLKDRYKNDGPDFLFDPKRFDPSEWSRIQPPIVETARAEVSASATVTAMDYGGVGQLRAFATSADCSGNWQPIPIEIDGRKHDTLSIPRDEDGNLMADAYDEYRGDSGRDDETQPAGNGFAGDGFTAFEEYRGFMADGGYCDDPHRVWHARTKPDHKDLLVVINANDRGLEPGLRLFAYATELHVLTICDQHMVNGTGFGLEVRTDPLGFVNTPRGRVVNFTLQDAQLRVWKGRRLSLEPQRGIVLATYRPNCFEDQCGKQYGFADPVDEALIGPPKLTKNVKISQWLNPLETAVTLVHEMGHAIGIPHHSDSVAADWRLEVGRLNVNGLTSPYQRHSDTYPMSAAHQPAVDGLLIDPGPSCSAQAADARYDNGQFVGCFTTRIIRRGQQNSGEFHCPMRYRFGDHSHYEPPGATSRYVATRSVTTPGDGTPATLDHWSGQLLPYDLSRESITDFRSFCARTTGTLINQGADQGNHSGDTGRRKACTEFMVVNDRAASNVQ